MTDTTHAPGPGRPETASHSAAYETGRDLPRNRRVLYILGAVFLVAGVLALAMPFVATITAALLFGISLAVAGGVGMFTAAKCRCDGWEMASAFALSLLALVVGVLMVFQPLVGVLALTTLIIAYFAVGGGLRLYYGIRKWQEDGSGWLVASGAVSLVLAILLWANLPFSAVWVPGVLLGVDLLIWGTLLIAFGMALSRKLQAASEPA